jgi:RNA polymerase primary sigma factor
VAESPFDVASVSLRREDIGYALSALPERERRVIELRFGLDGV